MKRVLLAALIFTGASPVWAAQNTLTWVDNAINEEVYLVERKAEDCAASTLPFSLIVNTLPINTQQFIDTTVTEGVTYCYRVAAANVDAVSDYSNMAGRRVPFTKPASPSALTVGP